MKGFIIYEDYRGKKVVEAIKLGEVDYYTCKSSSSDDWTSELSGIRETSTQAYCNKEDTYDFEEGALIALMKMCGAKKTAEACTEAFPHETSGSIYRENKRYIKRIKELEKENEELHKNIDELFKDNKYWKSEVGRLSFEKHRLEEKVEKLQHEYDLCKNSENALKCSVGYLNKSIAKLNTAIYGYKEDLYKVAERCKELEEENEKLKLDCEKLQHGYIDTDMIFCGGRQNGKQYTFLKKLFKSIPKDKVEAAYEEAYDKWIKLPSSRERMWDDILKEGRTPVYVKREDIHAFLEECQVTGIKWATGKMPLETMPFHMSKGYDGIYFFVMTTLDISKSTPGVKEFRHVMCWWMTASDEEARNSVKYIAPMRWDLFEKSRIYIRVKAEHFEEFKKACKAHLEKEPLSPFTYYSNGDVIVCYTDGHFRLTKTLNGFKKRPIVNWEDVR